MAQENNVKGTVVVKFVVGKDGSIEDVTISKNMGIPPVNKKLSKKKQILMEEELRLAAQACDQEAVRVISRMPKWKPGMQSGKPVRCYFSVPVRFVLQ